ncbi:MAG: hypothetical protein OXH83_05695 [Bryobacterales bacterium]|nr:hypothetical protein [Bryobacterales bacterium]
MRLLISRDGQALMEEAATIDFVDEQAVPLRPAPDQRSNALVTVGQDSGCQQNLANALIPVGNVLNQRAVNG